MKRTDHNFRIPPLPRDRYDFLQEFVRRFTLTQRQVVILGLNALETLAVEDMPRLMRAIEVERKRHKGGSKGLLPPLSEPVYPGE